MGFDGDGLTELLSLPGHGVRQGGCHLPSLCPCRDMKIVVGDVLYRTVVPSGHIPVRCQTQGTATVTNSPDRGQSSVERVPLSHPHRPVRDKSSVERRMSRFPVNVPSGTKRKTKHKLIFKQTNQTIMRSMRNNTYTQIHIQMVFAVQNRDS